ncbi:MAG: SAM-dependent DNA methyltransferase [Planctomycetaceae bacterium]|nr:SAM-dependent DNA methyltransferase [Planctomycetaceae bacterium]
MSKIAPLESLRLAEQVRLDALKTAVERNKLGQFATPPALALQIANYVQDKLNGHSNSVRFLDPAIGTGSFYAAFLSTFAARNIDKAVGIEIDREFANAASSIWQTTGLQVTTGDFTRQPEPDERFNLILTNPPYVRHHHLNGNDKIRLRDMVLARLGIKLSGLAGLYCYFLLLADAWLETDGLAVWLIPSEFMDVNYGVAIKRYLTDKVTLLHIHRFCPSDVQFRDALVSSAVVVFRKATPPEDHTVEFSFGGSLPSPAKSQQVPLVSLRGKLKWTGYPFAGEEAPPSTEPTLGDFFTIKRGLATGDNNFFILPRTRATELRIPKEFLKPILPSPRYLDDVVVESDPDGYPNIEMQLALIDCDLPESEVKRRHPTLWKYLETGMANSIHNRYITSHRVPWYSQERRPPAPFLCTYMGRSRGAKGAKKPFRFIWNQSDATAANVYLMLYPKPEMQAALKADASLYRLAFDILNEIGEKAFTSEGRVYGGGLFKVEPAELARIPVAALAKAAKIRTRKPRQLVAFA